MYSNLFLPYFAAHSTGNSIPIYFEAKYNSSICASGSHDSEEKNKKEAMHKLYIALLAYLAKNSFTTAQNITTTGREYR